MTRFVAASVLGVILLAPAIATAQEERRVGLSMGYPASLGLLWHATDRVAVRPDVTFSTVSSEVEDRGGSGSAFSVGATVLFYTLQRDALSTYVAPSYLYAHSSNESASGLETTARTHQFGGSFGVQYKLGERVRVFGETGLYFAANKTEADDVFDSELTSNRFGNRGAVGLIFYF